MGHAKPGLGAIGPITDYVMRVAADVSSRDPAPVTQIHERRRNSEIIRRAHAVDKMGVTISEKDKDALLANRLENTRAMAAVRKWSNTDVPVLVLCGSVGTGKTLAVASAGIIFGRGVYVSASRLVHESKREERQNIFRAPLVGFDDLGAEDTTPYWLEIFGYFIDVRYVEHRTLITTNLTPKAIQFRYGERIWDRLRASAIFVEIAGPSMRKAVAL